MGVSGLLSFASSSYNNSSSIVRIATEVLSCHTYKPLIVCDGGAMLWDLYPKDLPCIQGGQWMGYQNYLKDLVTKFRNYGIELLFVFDGKVDEEKKNVWFRRRKKNHDDNCEIFDYVRRYGEAPALPKIIPVSAHTTALILKSLGVEVIVSFTDADAEIAFQASKRNAMAVITNDSDLLIYNCGCPIYTVEDLNIHSMTAKKISPVHLRNTLRLEQSDMPVLACLLGNDRFPRDELMNFHVTLKRKLVSGHFATKVASYIRDQKSRGCSLRKIAESAFPGNQDKIARFMFGVGLYILPNERSPWMVDSSQSLEYCRMTGCVFPPNLSRAIDGLSGKYSRAFLDRIINQHAKGDIPATFYTILFHKHYEASSCMEDKELSDIPSVQEMYAKWRHKIYSFILMHQPNSSVSEWHADKNSERGIVDNSVPVPPAPENYDIVVLHSPGQSRDMKFQALFHILNVPGLSRRLNEMSRLPGHFAVLSIQLHYLYHEIGKGSFIGEKEVNAYIAQALHTEWNDQETMRDMKTKVDTRATNLASVYIRGIRVLGLANAACGNPLDPLDFCPSKLFNGVLFAKKYHDVTNGIKDLLEDNHKDRQRFDQLKDLVMNAKI